LVEAADAERQRIERDIHDGVQQQLVGLRIKLELAVEAIKEEPARGEQMLSSIGRQMDDLIGALRSLARDIYPSLLGERGVVAAVRSAAQRAPLPVSFRTDAVGRYADAIEVAVYFCCVEAIQNVVKHGGPGAEAVVRFWEDGELLRFEVADSGMGFDVESVTTASGLVNMSDRIEAVGGNLTVRSRVGLGTSIQGRVPIAPPGEPPIVA
jgi:signal transduction histidine kinase